MLQCLAWRADMRLSAVVRLPRIPARAAALHGPNAGCVSTSTVRIDWTRGFRSYDTITNEGRKLSVLYKNSAHTASVIIPNMLFNLLVPEFGI
jgi:hypothetical protein